jgi:type II secretory pathway predicted ATPase ExeA
VYGIEAGLGFSTLIAEPGMGKTTLLNRILSYFRSSARTAFIFETQCNSHELLRNLLLELEVRGAEDETDNIALLNHLKRYLLSQAKNRRRVLLIVDEAQNLDDAVLEAIRLLSNFETFETKLLHIVLAGQPQLANKLGRPEMAQLRQRISKADRLRPFAPEDSVKYVAHRLKVAGYSGPPPFSPEALCALVSESRGVPRELNRLCFNALSLGCATQKSVVDDNIMREVVADLDFGEEGAAPRARENLDLSAFELAAQFSSALNTQTAAPVAGTHAKAPGGARDSVPRTMPGPAYFRAPEPAATFEHRSAIRSGQQSPHTRANAPGAVGGIAARPLQDKRRRPPGQMHDTRHLEFRAIPGETASAPVSMETTPDVNEPIWMDQIPLQTCYELRTRPRVAVIASVILPLLLGLWLLLGNGGRSSGRAASWLMGETEINSPAEQQPETAGEQEQASSTAQGAATVKPAVKPVPEDSRPRPATSHRRRR